MDRDQSAHQIYLYFQTARDRFAVAAFAFLLLDRVAFGSLCDLK